MNYHWKIRRTRSIIIDTALLGSVVAAPFLLLRHDLPIREAWLLTLWMQAAVLLYFGICYRWPAQTMGDQLNRLHLADVDGHPVSLLAVMLRLMWLAMAFIVQAIALWSQQTSPMPAPALQMLNPWLASPMVPLIAISSLEVVAVWCGRRGMSSLDQIAGTRFSIDPASNLDTRTWESIRGT